MTCKEIRIEETTIASVAGHPADPEPTTVLHLSAPLTVAMAEALKCRDMVFTVNDNARQFEGKITLPLALGEGDAELVLPTPGGGRHTMRPVKIHKFTVGHESDLKLEVSFRAHFKGEAEAQVISDLLHGWNKTEFFTTIISTQGELFAEKAPAADAGEGTKVDLTVDGPLFAKPKKEKSGCKHCDAGIPHKERDDSEHVNGEGCKLWDQPANPMPPMETAFLHEETGPTTAGVDPATYEPTTEQPNENGVYFCDPTVSFEKRAGKLFGSIEALLIAPDEWISALCVESAKHTHSEPLSNAETFSSLDVAIALKAVAGERIARAQINQHKGAAAIAWLELAGWFQQHWATRRTSSFETVEQWATYLEGLTEPEAAEAVQ